MVAVLTGDIINSREGNTANWLDELKRILGLYGKEPQQWQVFRGDSFQLSIAPNKALLVAIHLKAGIRQTRAQDVRIGIGLGKESHHAKKISESNGPAYILSGACFESLKKQTLAINSARPELDDALNLMLSLALLTANQWSSTVARVITKALEHPEMNQQELAGLLKKSQSSVSEALKRGGFDEIMNLNSFYQHQIHKL
jgi:hypothetical protein